MNVETFTDYDALSLRAAEIIASTIRAIPSAHLCLATGASPLGGYRQVASLPDLDTSLVRVTKLDEWIGVASTDEVSCEAYLQTEVIGPWRIDPRRYLAFEAETGDPEHECARIETALQEIDRFDLCVLGIGSNGHIGLNEPASELHLQAHVATLAESTRSHPMLEGRRLTNGMTLGLGGIFRFDHLLLLVVGESKREAWDRVRKGSVSTECPASLLHLHPRVTCLVFVSS